MLIYRCILWYQDTKVQSLGWEDPLEKEMAPHSSTLAWEAPWTEEPGGLQSMGSPGVRHDWATNTFTFNCGIIYLYMWMHMWTYTHCIPKKHLKLEAVYTPQFRRSGREWAGYCSRPGIGLSHFMFKMDLFLSDGVEYMKLGILQ